MTDEDFQDWRERADERVRPHRKLGYLIDKMEADTNAYRVFLEEVLLYLESGLYPEAQRRVQDELRKLEAE